jgi:hypothetical protein
MCRRIVCASCGKPGFAGCGLHVEQVLRDVAPAERCRCHEQAQPSEAPKRTSWLKRFFG